jgi:hypothetical protein
VPSLIASLGKDSRLCVPCTLICAAVRRATPICQGVQAITVARSVDEKVTQAAVAMPVRMPSGRHPWATSYTDSWRLP